MDVGRRVLGDRLVVHEGGLAVALQLSNAVVVAVPESHLGVDLLLALVLLHVLHHVLLVDGRRLAPLHSQVVFEVDQARLLVPQGRYLGGQVDLHERLALHKLVHVLGVLDRLLQAHELLHSARQVLQVGELAPDVAHARALDALSYQFLRGEQSILKVEGPVLKPGPGMSEERSCVEVEEGVDEGVLRPQHHFFLTIALSLGEDQAEKSA
mmetsp:Transcript_17989/g.30627  ORF Transcript_17989/g.30627 Transcript_17989/m.30627 type:complete len:211 (-) Transcript_17989:571-1203(-)